MPSALLVDDHEVIVVALTMALEASGFGPVAAVGVDDLSPETVMAKASSLRPDIVLLDLHLGGDRLSLSMIGPLIELGAKVILFTASSDPLMLAKGLRAGAEAVIDKGMPFHRLVAALGGLARGTPLMSTEEREALLEVLETRLAEEEAQLKPFAALTPREAQVLRDLVYGQSPKQIARSEGISLSTVRGHIDRILGKLGASSQREALAMARAACWPKPPRPSGLSS